MKTKDRILEEVYMKKAKIIKEVIESGKIEKMGILWDKKDGAESENFLINLTIDETLSEVERKIKKLKSNVEDTLDDYFNGYSYALEELRKSISETKE